MTTHPSPAAGNGPLGTIVVLAALYAIGLFFGLPQRWTDAVVSGHATHEPAADAAHLEAGAPPPAWMVTPFVLLLGAIAAFPLLPHVAHWWESNLNRFLVAGGLGLVTLGYYAFVHKSAMEIHWPAHAVVAPGAGGVQSGFVKAVLANAILSEFIPFIVLLFSLYTIAGGIRIEGDLRADPLTNAKFMAVGGLLASLIGTTGAAMLLVRPLLETNRERKFVAHTVIFFIFIVCNCGGVLLPIGDPPLFLGYLEGVWFTWTLGLWKVWLLVNGLLLAVYFVFDKAYFHRHEAIRDIERDIALTRPLRFGGIRLNAPLLLGVVLAVALLDPSKPLPGTDWHPWMFLREIVLLSLVGASLWFGSSHTRAQNNFSYAAIVEVAALFVGIFICMQPALELLRANGAYLVERFNMGPPKFFWASAVLSSFLDNAPTYLVFFQTARGSAPAVGPTAGVPELLLTAISLGSVFGGAMTYIGNGPNFMVKAIAETEGVRMPSFFGYMVYSCLILLPILALAQWIFLPLS